MWEGEAPAEPDRDRNCIPGGATLEMAFLALRSELRPQSGSQYEESHRQLRGFTIPFDYPIICCATKLGHVRFGYRTGSRRERHAPFHDGRLFFLSKAGDTYAVKSRPARTSGRITKKPKCITL